ncbi:MAG: hypothetical protein FWF23_02850 [Alphaproteobacteria bacterium]|nr:hypothetical protein [Alphaproteobacteria bacterium]MCL2504943.1 hypothetical protein [Alphaproteobacteria bacterium]
MNTKSNQTDSGKGSTVNHNRRCTDRAISRESLNEIEQNAVFNMVSYVADVTQMSEDSVNRFLTDMFRVKAVSDINSNKYEEVMECLMEVSEMKVH